MSGKGNATSREVQDTYASGALDPRFVWADLLSTLGSQQQGSIAQADQICWLVPTCLVSIGKGHFL